MKYGTDLKSLLEAKLENTAKEDVTNMNKGGGFS
jgi:hypothetical protein